MERAAMPKTTIDKNHHATARENDVYCSSRFDEQRYLDSKT